MTGRTRSVPVGHVRRFGDRAFLVGVEDAAAGRALAGVLRQALEGGAGTTAGAAPDAVDVVGGQATVLVALRDDDAEPEPVRRLLAAALASWRSGPADRAAVAGGPGAGRLVTIACAFDGPDLDEVASRARRTRHDVVELLTARPLTVGVVGFSPGFAYLEGLPDPLAAVRRRAEPRPVVPAGSVAVANGHAAVYPTASPGGWHLVGRTGAVLFSAEHPPYAVLAPGDRVHLRVAGPSDSLAPVVPAVASWSPPSGARPVLEVLSPGLRAVVQDGGRRGVAAAGVPAADPADPVSLALANRLLHNAVHAGTLELTGGGTRLRALAPCHVAVVGAAPEVLVDGVPVPAGRVLPLGEGQVLAVRALRQGCRTYVAVAGGIEGPALFGSRASDELTGLGPGPLGPGHRLAAGPWEAPLGDHVAPGAPSRVRDDGEPVVLRVVPGPHAEHFVPDAVARLAGTVFRVRPESNRVGLRLRAEDGADPAYHRTGAQAAGALDSHGVVTGAVQLPPGGEPVVLGPDHATLGGYPVVAVVVRADHGRLGQCGPGTLVRLVPVGHEEADEAARAERRDLRSAVRGRYPLAAG